MIDSLLRTALQSETKLNTIYAKMDVKLDIKVSSTYVLKNMINEFLMPAFRPADWCSRLARLAAFNLDFALKGLRISI